MNIFRKNYFLFKLFVKIELSYAFTTNLLTTAENCMDLIKTGGFFLLLVIICVPPKILDSEFAGVLLVIIC